MPIDRLLAELEAARRAPADPRRLLALIDGLERANLAGAEPLTRYHDALLFLCAYPPSPTVLRRAESILRTFGRRNLPPLLDPEVSGIAGTSVDVVFSYDLVRWLARKFPRQISIDWEEAPDTDRLAAVMAQIDPILGEEIVDAHPAFFERLRQSGGLPWLLRNLEKNPQAAILYDSLGLWIEWMLGNSPATRTRMRRRPKVIFYQRTPPLERREVSIARELASPPMPIARLSRREGEEVLDMARAALAVRYRELYGFTFGDPAAVLRADAGRGLEIYLAGLRRDRRLPLRAGFAPLLVRNGVPVGYADAYGLCERMEVSFNIFYAFRDGESAWCFARLLKLYHQLFGSRVFSIDPYQIGEGNEEALEAGAFWFYRKLGFRSTDPAIERIARREEERMAKDPLHRTRPGTLKKLARSPMVCEAEGARIGEWDHFRIANVVTKLARRPPLLRRLQRVNILAPGAEQRQLILRLGRRRRAPPRAAAPHS